MIYLNRALAVASSSLCALLVMHSPAHSEPSNGASRAPLTVAAALEMRRVLNGLAPDPISLSPDGTRYVIQLARDDLEREGVWVELIAGRTDSIESATQATTVARQFTTARADEYQTNIYPPTHPALSNLIWLDDNERVAFRWNDGNSLTQVLAVNVRTGEQQPLTRHPTSVSDFAVKHGGAPIIYLAYPGRSQPREERMATMLRDGFAVARPNAVDTVLAGNFDGIVPWHEKQLFLATGPNAQPRRVECHEIRCEWIKSSDWKFSPDGRRVMLRSTPPRRPPAEWSRYKHADLQRALSETLSWPEDVEKTSGLSQIALVDVEQARLRPLWSAPFPTRSPPEVVWSPDSRSVLVGPTFLPLDRANEEGMKGTAFAEVEISSGRVRIIPVPGEMRAELRPKHWRADGVIELSDGTRRLFFRKVGGPWRATAMPRQSEQLSVAAPVRIELRQDLNASPALHAVETKSGREQMILDVEPRLRSDFQLGHVENVEWQDAAGRTWQGRLHYPVGHSVSRRYPLVIQLVHFSSATEFSISGGGFRDSMGTAFAAQALANRGIATLSLHRHAEAGERAASPEEPELMKVGVESAVDHFVSEGLTEREKVGLVGYSRTGWYVEYILAHSEYPFGAAIAADNYDSSYVQSVLAIGLAGEPVRNNGGPAYGEGLKAWIERAPGFNAYRIRTPLRLEVDTGGVKALLLAWEMYAQLNHLRKPVELVLVPESAAASHPLQMPRQKRFSQEGTVDWMDFWLNGREHSDANKSEQYERWRKLRALL